MRTRKRKINLWSNQQFSFTTQPMDAKGNPVKGRVKVAVSDPAMAKVKKIAHNQYALIPTKKRHGKVDIVVTMDVNAGSPITSILVARVRDPRRAR